MTTRRWMTRLVTATALLVGACLFPSGTARAGYCYTPSYPQSYGGYSTYVQPYYQYYPQYVSYPVASYVGIPIPIFGSIYTGPNGATQTATTTTTRTAVATSTVGTAATATTGVAGASLATASSDTQQILASLKSLTLLVGQVAQKGEAVESRLLTIEQKHAECMKRLLTIEARVNGVPGPGPGPAGTAIVPAPPRKDGPPQPASLPAFYKAKCFACHQEGQPDLAKGKGKDRRDLVLFTRDGQRAPLLTEPGGIDQAQAMLTHVTDETMPPATKGPDGKRKYAALTPDEQTAAILDLKNFPRRR